MCFMLRLLDALPLTHGTLESDTAERCRQVLWPVSRPHELLSGLLPRNRIDTKRARSATHLKRSVTSRLVRAVCVEHRLRARLRRENQHQRNRFRHVEYSRGSA